MEGKSILRAAIYIRVSTEEQAHEGQSASAQEETLRQYCNAYNIEIFDVYMDLGISGRSLRNRTELIRLLEDCKCKRFNLVLVWKISRLSRNLKDLLYLIDVFESCDVHFTSFSEKFDTSTPLGRMTLQLLGSISEFERNTIVENVRLGLIEFSRKGGKASSVLGYDNINKKLIINESEANIIRLIFSLYAEKGMSFSGIAKHLNNSGYRTKRGRRYRSSSISYIIRNPVYIGINRHNIGTENEYSVEGSHPAIISQDMWQKVRNKDEHQYNNIVRSSHDSIIFKVNCMKCNSVMKIFYTYSKGKKYRYLRCCKCSNYVNWDRLQGIVLQRLLALLEDKKKHKILYAFITDYLSASEAEFIELASLESEINRLQNIKSQYLKLFECNKIDDIKAFLDRIKEIEGQLGTLEERKLNKKDVLLTEENILNYEEYFTVLKRRITESEPFVINAVCSCLIKYIEAYKNDVNIVLYL